MISLGSLLLELHLDTDAFNRDLEITRSQVLGIAKRLEADFKRQATTRLAVQVNDQALTKLNKHLDRKRSHLNEVQYYFNSHPLKIKTDDSELTRLNQKLAKVKNITSEIRVVYKDRLSAAKQSTTSTTNIQNKQSSDYNSDKLASKISEAIQKGFKEVRKNNSKNNNIGSGIVIGGVAGIALGVVQSVQSGLKNVIKQQAGQILKATLSDLSAKSKSIPNIQDTAKKYVQAFLQTPLPKKQTVNTAETSVSSTAPSKTTPAKTNLDQTIMAQINKRDILEPLASSVGIKGARKASKQELVQQLIKAVPEDILRQKLPFMVESSQQVQNSVRKRSSLDPTALKKIVQPILKDISTRSRSSLRGSQLADLSNDIEREYQIVLGMLSQNLPKDAKNILQGAKMTLGRARAEAIRNAIAEVKERTKQPRSSPQSQGLAGLARMSGSKDPLQPMKDLRRDALRQMRQNYQDIFAELAKANNYALDLKRLPKLVVDNAALRNMGADAFYDIRNNQILISKEIHKALQQTPQELAEAEEILKTLAHEARHVFQSDYGRIPLEQMIKGASAVPLVDPSKASTQAVRSARRNIRQIRRDNPKMPWTQLKGVEALEIDAYQSEDAAKQVAARLRQNASQRQTTKQVLQQTFDNLLEIFRNFTKEVDAIAPVIRTSFIQLKDSLQDGAAQLYENAKEWLHFAINPKPKTVLSNQGLARMQGSPTLQEVQAFIKNAQRYARVLERSARTQPAGSEETSGTRFVNRLIPRSIRRAVNQGQSQGVDAFNFVSQNIPNFFKNPVVEKILTYKLKFDIKGMSDVIDQFYKDLNGFFKFVETKAGQSPYLGEFLQKLTGGFKNVNLAAVGATAVFFRFFSMMKYIGYLQQLSAATIATASAFEALNRQFILASKTEAQGAQSLQNIFNTTRELRLSRNEAIEGSMQIQAGLRSRILDQRQIDQFQGAVAQTARVYGKNPQEYQQIYGGFAQLTQNPTINQQDIAQLQSSVPDAFAIMARAAGTTEAEFQRMLNTGTLITSEFLPALTNQLQVETAPKVGKAVDTIFAANQRLENSFQDLQLSFSSFVLPLEKMRINLYADAIERATGLSALFGNALNGLAAFGVYKFGMAVVRLAEKIIVIARAIPALNLAILAMARIAQQVATNILPIALKMSKELLIFQVVVDTFGIVSTAFQNAGGKIKEFAEQSAKNLQEYRKALLEAKGASLDFVKSLPETTDQIKGGGTYLEKTFLGGLLPKDWQRNIENYYLKDPLGAQSGLGIILRATGAKPYTEKVTGDMKAESQKAIATSQERISEINSQFNPGSILQQLRQFDKDLDKVQNRRRAIAIVDPGNRREMELLKHEEERIIKQREGLSKPVESLSAGIAADVKGFQESLAEYDRLAQDGAITGEEYRERTGELRDALEKAQSAQDQLNKVVKSSLTPLQAFERAWAKIATSLEDTKTALERNLNLSKTAIAQRESSGSITQGQADFESAIEQQKMLQKQMQANVLTIRQMYAELNNQNASEIFNNLGIDSNTGAAQIRAIAEQAEGYPREKALLEKFAQTKDIEQQAYQLQAQVAEARTGMVRQLRDMTKNVADYYRGVQRQAEETAIETEKLRSQVKVSSQQNKLRKALLGVQDNIVTQFVEGIIESMGQMNQASEIALDAQSKMLQNRNQYEDSVRQAVELSRSVPGELPKIPIELDLSAIRNDANIAAVQSEIENSVSATKDLEGAIASSTEELNDTARSADELYKNLTQGVIPIEESEKALQEVGQGLEKTNSLTSQSSQLSQNWSQSLGGVQQALGGIGGFFTNILQYIQQAIASTGEWLSGLTNSLNQVGNTISNTLTGLNEQRDNQLGQVAGAVGSVVSSALFGINPKRPITGGKLKIVESVGGRVETINSYEDLEKHHPSSGIEPGRSYAKVDGQLEEVRHTPGGILVKKDFVLQNSRGSSAVDVPAPISGYAQVSSSYGRVGLYDKPGGNLVGNVLHLDPRTFKVKSGDFVQYGQPLGIQSGTGAGGNTGAYGVHAHVEVAKAQFQRYIKDILDGTFDSGFLSSAQSMIQKAMPNVVNPQIRNPIDAASIAQKRNLQSLVVTDVASGKTIANYKGFQSPASPASTIKLIVADLLVDAVAQGRLKAEQALTIRPGEVAEGSSLQAGQRISVKDAVTRMLRDSENTSTNVLISALGGTGAATQMAQGKGYRNTRINNLLSIPGATGFGNTSTAIDTSAAMRSLLTNNSAIALVAQQAVKSTRNFNYEGEIGGKIGNNTRVIGNVGLANVGGRQVIIAGYSNTDGNVLSNRSRITNASNDVVKSLSARTQSQPVTPPRISPPQLGRALSTFGGSASFYGGGDGFDGQKTANGEIFNTNKLTAAHKTLPFGTMVRVTNANNGKSVVVRINDRGPYIKGRTIDLSKAAAEQIGMVKSGHAPIKGEVLGKVPKGAEGDRMIAAANASGNVSLAQVSPPKLPKLSPLNLSPVPKFTMKAANMGGTVAPSQLQQTIANGIEMQQEDYVKRNELTQKQRDEDLEKAKQDALRQQQRNLDQFRRAGRDLRDEQLSGRRQVTDLAASANKNPTPKQTFAMESTRIQREYDDAIKERRYKIEDAQQRLKAGTQAIASGEIKSPEEKSALQKQMQQDIAYIKEAGSEIQRLKKMQLDAAKEAERLFKREEMLRRQSVGFAQERSEIDILSAKIENAKQAQTNQPYSPEALGLPALEEALALRQADLNLAEKIAQVEEDRFKHQLSPEEAEARIEAYKRENIQIQQSITNTRKRAEEEKRIDIARRSLEYREQVTGLNTEFMRSQIQLRGLGKGDADVLELTRKSALMDQNMSYERQKFDYEESARVGQRSQEEVANLINALNDLNRVKIDVIQATFAKDTEDAAFNTKQRLFQSDQDLAGAQTEFLRSRGFEKQARDIEKQSAIAAQEFNFASSIRDLEQLVAKGDMASDVAAALRQNFELLNEVKLANIQAQFDPWMQTFANAQQSFQSFFGSVLSGSSSIGDAFAQMVDSIAQNLANLAAQFITNELFKNLFGLGMPQQTQFGLGGGGLFGGGSSGGLLGDIFGFANMALPIFGMAKGGIVRNYAEGGIVKAMMKERAATGARPQLAVLSEGEMVLTIAQAKRFQDLNLHKVVNYADGGIVGRASVPVINNRVSEGGMTINVPVTVNGGDAFGNSKAERASVNVPQLQSAIRAVVVQEIQNQQRPGGAINR